MSRPASENAWPWGWAAEGVTMAGMEWEDSHCPLRGLEVIREGEPTLCVAWGLSGPLQLCVLQLGPCSSLMISCVSVGFF